MGVGQHFANRPQSGPWALAGGHSLGQTGEPAAIERQGKGQVSGSEERLEANGFWLKTQGEDWEGRLGCFTV